MSNQQPPSFPAPPPFPVRRDSIQSFPDLHQPPTPLSSTRLIRTQSSGALSSVINSNLFNDSASTASIQTAPIQSTFPATTPKYLSRSITGISNPPALTHQISLINQPNDVLNIQQQSVANLKQPMNITNSPSSSSIDSRRSSLRKFKKNTRERRRRNELNIKFDRLKNLLNMEQKLRSELENNTNINKNELTDSKQIQILQRRDIIKKPKIEKLQILNQAILQITITTHSMYSFIT